MSFVAGLDNYPLMNPVYIEDIPKFPSLIVLPLVMIVNLTVAVLRGEARANLLFKSHNNCHQGNKNDF